MNMSMDLIKLQVTLDGQTDIIARRDFTHPPARVWRALTEPELLRQWMAISNFPMTRCEFEARPGGTFHFEWAGSADVDSFFFAGPVQKVDAPHHLTYVQYLNGDTDVAATISTDLVARGTWTRMTITMSFANADARAGAIASGMTDGMDEVYSKLEALLTAE
jgi:uncharacterized protein YndB with AHSA1/START domain